MQSNALTNPSTAIAAQPVAKKIEAGYRPASIVDCSVNKETAMTLNLRPQDHSLRSQPYGKGQMHQC